MKVSRDLEENVAVFSVNICYLVIKTKIPSKENKT